MRYLSNKFYKNIDHVVVEESEIVEKANLEYKALEQFRKVEYCLYYTLEQLRNYHSHHVHEPGINNFEDLIEYEKELDQDELNRAKDWFSERFLGAKNHLIKSLELKKTKEEGYRGIKKN